MPASDPFALARRAISERRWTDALGLLDDDTVAGSAIGLELRAEAAYGGGDPEASVDAWEDLYELHLAAGDEMQAARAAAMVAMYLMIDTGLMAPIRGWLRRAERLIAEAGDTPVHAVVAMVRTYERLWCGDMETAGICARTSIELGRRHGIEASVLIGRVASARLLIFEGHTDEGLEILDDVALTLMSGAVDDMTSGMAYCELICAVQGLAMYERAGEWTQAMEHWRHDSAFGGFSGRCRVHHAEMYRLTGPCDRAEEEALEACEELRPWMRREFGWPLTELGNIRLRKGDLAGAEEAFLAGPRQLVDATAGPCAPAARTGRRRRSDRVDRRCDRAPLRHPVEGASTVRWASSRAAARRAGRDRVHNGRCRDFTACSRRTQRDRGDILECRARCGCLAGAGSRRARRG